MKVSLEIPIDDSEQTYQPLITFLDERNLLAANQNEDIDPIEDLTKTNILVNRIFGLYPIVFNPNRFYGVVFSYPFVGNYGFFQANEIIRAKNEDMIINKEIESYLSMLKKMQNEIETYKPIRDIREGFYNSIMILKDLIVFLFYQ